MPLSVGQFLNKRYRIERQIGQGGFGAVYRAYDVTLQQPCAIKENLNTGAEAQRQFEREALLLARLRHPNLPRVIDHFTRSEQGQYLVMDFVEGHSLAELLKLQSQPLAEGTALGWIDQVCQALAYLHQQTPPIIHRDIKPQNIIITPDGQAMLVDFGLSKLYDEQSRTNTGARGLTFGYAPPEQYGEGRTNARTDVYGLGATLYTMLTGQRPPDAIQRLVNHEPLLPPSQLTPQVSPQVEQAVLKAMALAPSERFESVERFRRALTIPLTRPVIPVKPQEVERPGRAAPFWLGATLVGSLISLGLVVAVFGLGYWAFWGSGFNNILEPTPTRRITAIAAVSTFTMLPTSTWTPVATRTLVIPSSTPTLSATPSSTHTPLPPAGTPAPASPTNTLVPPTDTPSPPTDTPTPSPTPTPEFPFELAGVEKRSEQSVTMFQGVIRDAAGNPLDNYFVQASCGSYSIISFPSGPIPWGAEKAGADSELAWEPGYYDINLAASQPCQWALTLVETDDRQTVKARLSPTITVAVGPNESPIIVNWRRVN